MGSHPFSGAALLSTLLWTITSAYAAGPENWVPVRWQGGPLELQRRAAAGRSMSAAEAAVLREWYHPRTLALVENTPINCLLAPWSAGADKSVELQQQKMVTAYAREAHTRGIAVVGLVYAGADLAVSVSAAAAAGLDGLALDPSFESTATPNAFVGIPIIALTAGATPRVRAMDDSVAATPTTEPWIDFNFSPAEGLMERETQPVWLAYTLEEPCNEDVYLRAIADAVIAGGRWVVAPNDDLMMGLWRGDSSARTTWRHIHEYLRFYEQHAESRLWSQPPALGVIQQRDFDGETAHEILKLIARRRIPFRRIYCEQFNEAAAERWFATLVIGHCDRTPASAIVAGADTEPDALAKELLDAVGKENLPARIFNAPSALPRIGLAPNNHGLLVQIVNYASMPAQRIVVRAKGGFRRATLFRPAAPPLVLPLEKTGDRVEALIPEIAVSAALLFEK